MPGTYISLAETELYYLSSRYYDPETGRFVNADGYVSTGQGLLGNNMFAYCLNNPVNYADPSGGCPICILENPGYYYTPLDYMADFCDRHKIDTSKNQVKEPVVVKRPSMIDEDGNFSLYDNHRFDSEELFHEQVFSGSVSGPSFNLEEGSVGLGSVEANIIQSGWEWEHADLSLLDLGHAEASLEFKDGALSASAFASVWSPSFSVSFWGLTIEISGEVGAIGGSVDFGKGIFSAKGAGGLGAGVTITWDK